MATASIPDLSFGQDTEDRFRDIVEESARRRMEALNIYEPLPEQQAFHRSDASERILRGGRRAGKSVSAFAETARCALGRDPYGKFPTNRPVIIWIVCYNQDQIGRTAHRLLFRSAFSIIRDLETEEWRAYQAWNPQDVARKRERRAGPPLIPKRFAPDENFQWKSKKGDWWMQVQLNFGPDHPMHGSRIYAFPSGASHAPQGDAVDVIHIDEDLVYDTWINELHMRLPDLGGRLWWSVAPHNRNNALIQMCDRAEQETGLLNPDIQEFRLTFSGNPHIPPEEKEKQYKRWATPEERRAYDLGDFLLDDVLMYPSFSMDTHGVPSFDIEEKPIAGIDEVLRSNQVPHDWTRYMVIDPAHTLCGVLFAAVPPPRYGDYVVLEDELYLRQANAMTVAKAIEPKVLGKNYHAFIIDEHMGRQTQASGKTVKQQYAEELRKRNIRSHSTGFGFISGSDDVPGRCGEVRRWLTICPEGTTRLRVLRDRLPWFEYETKRYKRRLSPNSEDDKPVNKHNHLMHCLEYLAAYNPRYHPPRKTPENYSPAMRAYHELERRFTKKRPGGGSIYLGPGKTGPQLAPGEN